MFCDGKCKIEKEVEDGTMVKKCGLFRTLIFFHNEIDGKTKEEEMCVFDAIMNSLHRQEQGQVRIQQSVNSQRNETVKYINSMGNIFCAGFNSILESSDVKFRLVDVNEKNKRLEENTEKEE